MFASMKRVVSNPEEIGSDVGKHPKLPKVIDDRNDDMTGIPHENVTNADRNGTPAQDQFPAVVEVDNDESSELIVSNAGRVESAATTVSSIATFSSLSSSGRAGDNHRSGRPRSSSGAWGWFEDVHDHDIHGESGGGRLGNSSRSEPKKRIMDGKDRSGNSIKKTGGKKKGGMLQFTQSMDKPLSDIVDPPKDIEPIALAVTPPTYVLGDSPSTQKLWKRTAGNRPPQPVEERAFFEKMWAQNFQRSQVKYEIPVEVLTATSPISLSPFADLTFGDEGAGEGGNGAVSSNYNLAAPFDANVAAKGMCGQNKDSSEMDAPPDAVKVKAAEADAAEATLMHRMGGGNSTWGLYDPTKPRDYDRTMLGPPHYHHTLVNKKVRGEDGTDEMTVTVRGDNVFGTTVSKSFAKPSERGGPIDGVVTVSVSIASYRVVESKKHGKYAQYLVIYCEGSFRDTVGVWKRYSDFDDLACKVTQGNEMCASALPNVRHSPCIAKHPEGELLPNAVKSWRLLKKRQRWFRCLDAGYLSLKVFLLERFLHDILFESSNQKILRDFVGVDAMGH